ncbi:MAG: SAM-dependent chlorinase/fluorinase [Myxococcota bacterium]
MTIITLLTDFGLRDPFVGVMKGVILGIAPNARLVDLSHDVPPQDIATGARMLAWSVRYFPAGSIHVAVVDPGVGSTRAAVAVQAGDQVLVGPDNGLFTAVLRRHRLQRAVRLENPAYQRHPVSSTFHGRDVFAPVAAHLASGVPLEALGPVTTDVNLLDLSQPLRRGRELVAHVVHVDTFGNLVLDLEVEALREAAAGGECRFRVGDRVIDGLSRTYADVREGALLAYPGSQDDVEIGIRNGSAARALGVGTGAEVIVELPRE